MTARHRPHRAGLEVEHPHAVLRKELQHEVRPTPRDSVSGTEHAPDLSDGGKHVIALP